MQTQSDYPGILVEENKGNQMFFDAKLNYFLNDIMQKLEIESAEEINQSLERAFGVFNTLNISIQNNFKKIYRYNGVTLVSDWKVSSLACYLIVINCNTVHESTAKAQLFFALNKMKF